MKKITRLMAKAAREGKLRMAARLIHVHGLSLCPEWSNGYEFLKIAVKNNKTAFVKLLLSKGCSVTKEERSSNDSLLHIAIEKRNMEIIELLLSAGIDVNGKNVLKEAPLLLAVRRRDSNIVQLLLEHGADANIKSQFDWTPLHAACSGNSTKIVNLLLAKGADVNAKTVEDQSILEIAVAFANLNIVKALLDQGAQADSQDKVGRSALSLALERGEYPFFEVVFKHLPESTNHNYQPCLATALRTDSKDFDRVVQALSDYGLDVTPEDAKDPDIFYGAVEKGNLKIVKDLVKNGADFGTMHPQRYDGSSPLHVAVQMKRLEMVALLLSLNADVNARDCSLRTPLFYAADNADLKMTELLCIHGANVRDDPEVLKAAVRKNSMEIIEFLVSHGADINARDAYEKTALHSTVFSEDEKGYVNDANSLFFHNGVYANVKTEIAAQYLLDKGADVDAQTTESVTTLHASIEKGFDTLTRVLLKNNANVHLADNNGVSPLHNAASNGNLDILNTLISKGAKVNAKQWNGDTPLHFAVHADHVNNVKMLLQNGALVNCKNIDGITPLHLAVRKGNPAIVDTLLSYAADVNSACGEGRTPLHISVRKGDARNVAQLLENGADTNIRCMHSFTPIEYAGRGRQYYQLDGEIDDYRSLRDTVIVFQGHRVKMEAADTEPTEPLSLFNSYRGFKDLYSECQVEIAVMKRELIKGTKMSYYDVLRKNARLLAKYMKNENMVLAKESEEYRSKFPLYGGMIRSQFLRSLARSKVLGPATQMFLRLVDLPEECAEKILEFFSDDDLWVLLGKNGKKVT